MGKKNAQNLGKSLIRSKRAPVLPGRSTRHTTELHDEPGKSVIQSITEQSALNEFITTAELANREFTAEKLNTTIVTPSHVPGILSEKELEEIKNFQDMNKELLNIPRRPDWNSSMTAAELEDSEKESFLQWRRQLAILDEKDEKLVLTPYEKNIDVWRQLWRVIERSDVLCQIVDARNPLMFKCNDLEKYVQEVDAEKDNIIIINKADFLTEKQRQFWAEYFDSINMTVLFWSALAASQSEKESAEEVANSKTPYEDRDSSEEDLMDTESHVESEHEMKDVKIVEKEGHENSDLISQAEVVTGNEDMDIGKEELKEEDHCQCEEKNNLPEEEGNNDRKNGFSVLSRTDLIQYFEDLKITKCPGKDKITIGMVGFPNVGKSSTINALLGTKKTSVSATPGKTKHFQTINISDEVCLCDCPGLVFPTFVSTKAEMVLYGILPVDQMRDYRPPSTLLCKLIPRKILENLYGINISRPGEGEDPDRAPTGDEFLSAYSSMRGFMTAHGMPDCARGSRHVIKDFLHGKLLYREPSPNASIEEFEPVSKELPKLRVLKVGENSAQSQRKRTTGIDKEFFSQRESSIHYNAPSGVRQLPDGSTTAEAKPWKKHFNRNKREKLRRIKND